MNESSGIDLRLSSDQDSRPVDSSERNPFIGNTPLD